MTYYAHSKDGRPPEEWQELEEHLRNVAELSEEFAGEFYSGKWASCAAFFHDLGKATNAFQSYLLKANELNDGEYDSDGSTSNHASAGAAFAIEKFGPTIGKIFAYIVAGHHAGLPDWYSEPTGNAALSIRLGEGQHNLEYIRDYAGKVSSSINIGEAPPFAGKPENLPLWMRMIFSCLTDADSLDTERFMRPDKCAARGQFKSMTELKSLFNFYMEKLSANTEDSPVNRIRREILSVCCEKALLPSGLFSLTVPTGGGKTLSSMAFALKHAVQYGKKRIIYVIPYTSIIEQTAAVLRKIFGEEQVIEHHSNIDPEKEILQSSLASENWDAPVIVTTNVQFFESLYAAHRSRCRKLHNMVNSIVILDEAQMLPPELLIPCVDVLNQLSANYGVTILFSTATQPALPKLNKVEEIISKELKLYERLKRTQINLPDMQERSNWKDIAKQLQEHGQVLCIVNTRRDCYELFNLMPENTVHLSALMCGVHRSRIIRYIKWRLRKNKPIRVISTQLVEAGVDIDFPVVYRALAGLDSIAQAAGRCNREGKLNVNGKLGEVYVFLPPKPAPPGQLLKGENALRSMIASSIFSPDDPEEYTRYFNLFYPSVNSRGKEFCEWLLKDVNPDIYIPFRTAESKFKLIKEQDRCSIIVRYNKDSGKWINQVAVIGPTRENMRKLQRYTVNIPERTAKRMKDNGEIEEIYESILAQTMPSIYDKKIGLNIFREDLPINDLIL